MGAIPRVPDCFAGTGGDQILTHVRMPCSEGEPNKCTPTAFGRRLRAAGLLGSMGSIGDCFDNSLAESFFGTLQLELLDRHHWQSRDQLASAIFDYVEAFYNPRRRHSSIDNLSPAEFESRHMITADAA